MGIAPAPPSKEQCQPGVMPTLGVPHNLVRLILLRQRCHAVEQLLRQGVDAVEQVGFPVEVFVCGHLPPVGDGFALEALYCRTVSRCSLLSRARENLRIALRNYIYMDGQAVPTAPEEEPD